MKITIFSEWQEYRGGRSLRQLLLEPIYFRKERYEIEYSSVTHAHLLLIIRLEGKRHLIVLDRLSQDQNLGLDVTLDYLENLSFTLEQWLDASGVFQVELDLSPQLLQIVKLSSLNFLVLLMQNGMLLLWKYDEEMFEWTFVCKYPLLSEKSLQSTKITSANIHPSTSSLFWIEKNLSQDHFLEEVVELGVTTARYRVRMTSLIWQSSMNTLHLSPPVTLFTANSYYDHSLSLGFYYYLTKENQLILYNYYTGRLWYRSLKPLLKKDDLQNAAGSFLSSLQLDRIFDPLDEEKTFYLCLVNEKRGRCYLYIFQHPNQSDESSWIPLVGKISVDHSYPILERPSLKKLSKLLSKSWLLLCQRGEVSYLCQLLPTSASHHLLLYQVSHANLYSKEKDETVIRNLEELPVMTLDLPFKYLHGRELQNSFFLSSFLHYDHSTTNSVDSTSSKSDCLIMPLLWGNSGFFQLNLNVNSSSFAAFSLHDKLLQAFHNLFASRSPTSTPNLIDRLEGATRTPLKAFPRYKEERNLEKGAGEGILSNPHYRHVDQFIYEYYLYLSPCDYRRFEEELITAIFSFELNNIQDITFGINDDDCSHQFDESSSHDESFPPEITTIELETYLRYLQNDLTDDSCRRFFWWNELNLLTLLPTFPGGDRFNAKLAKWIDPFLLQYLLSLLIPQHLTASLDEAVQQDTRTKEEEGSLSEVESSLASISSKNSTDNVIEDENEDDEEDSDDIFREVASEAASEPDTNPVNITHFSNIDGADDDRSVDGQLNPNYFLDEMEDPLITLRRNAEELTSHSLSRELFDDNDREKDMSKVYATKSSPHPKMKRDEGKEKEGYQMISFILHSLFLSFSATSSERGEKDEDQWKTFGSIYELFHFLILSQEHLCSLVLSNKLNDEDYYRSNSSTHSITQKRPFLLFPHSHDSRHHSFRVPTFSSRRTQSLSLFDQMFFDGFKATLRGAKGEDRDVESETIVVKDYVRNVEEELGDLSHQRQLDEIIRLKYQEHSSNLHNQRGKPSSNEKEQSNSGESDCEDISPFSSKLAQVRQTFLTQISSTVEPLLSRNFDEDVEDWLLRLLLLSEDYLKIAKYLIYRQRMCSVFYFCLRISTSANVMSHRNSLGVFSTMTEEAVSELYYYRAQNKGVQMKVKDVTEVILPALPESAINASNVVAASGPISAVNDEESMSIDAKEEDIEEEVDDEDDDDIFELCNIQYFKDRGRASLGSMNSTSSLQASKRQSRLSENYDPLPSLQSGEDAENSITEIIQDVNELRMEDAICIFYLAVEYFISLIHHYELKREDSSIITLLWTMLFELIACRPLRITSVDLQERLGILAKDNNNATPTTITQHLNITDSTLLQRIEQLILKTEATSNAVSTN